MNLLTMINFSLGMSKYSRQSAGIDLSRMKTLERVCRNANPMSQALCRLIQYLRSGTLSISFLVIHKKFVNEIQYGLSPICRIFPPAIRTNGDNKLAIMRRTDVINVLVQLYEIS